MAPVEPGAETAARATPMSVLLDAGVPERITILLVDDNRRFVELLTRFLATCFPDEIQVVATAEEAESALALTAECRPHAVILDLAMPGRSGLEIVPDLRRMAPALGIVVLTFLDSDEYRRAALASGADEFVGKGRLEADLVPAIRRAARPHTQRPARRGTA